MLPFALPRCPSTLPVRHLSDDHRPPAPLRHKLAQLHQGAPRVEDIPQLYRQAN